ILRPARPPIQMDLPLDPVLEDMAQHRLQRCEPRAAGDEQQRFRAGSIDELADGALDAQQGARTQLLEEPLGEAAARYVARVQLDEISRVRWTCDGKASAATVL